MSTQPLFTPGPGQLRCFNPFCRHVWFQRSATPPVRCPRCQSRHWFNPTYPFRAPRVTRQQTQPQPPIPPNETPAPPFKPAPPEQEETCPPPSTSPSE